MPGHIPIQYSKLPAVVMFPAKDKEPPFICASKVKTTVLPGSRCSMKLKHMRTLGGATDFEYAQT